MRNLKIKIEGEGNRREIIVALLSVIDSLADPKGNVDEQAGAGIEWEDSTLVTQINPGD